jgi:hypothetical protein
MRIAVALAITLGAFAVSPVLAASAESAEPVPPHKHHRAVEHAAPQGRATRSAGAGGAPRAHTQALSPGRRRHRRFEPRSRGLRYG